MRKLLLVSVFLLVAAAPPSKPKTPSEIVAEAPPGAWRDVAANDLLVMDLRNGAQVVIQLAPQFGEFPERNAFAVKFGSRGQYSRAREGRVVERRRDLSGPVQLRRPVGK